jgi:hypothetical protein
MAQVVPRKLAYFTHVGDPNEGYITMSLCRGTAVIMTFNDEGVSAEYLSELEALKDRKMRLYTRFGEPNGVISVAAERRLYLAWIQVCIGFRDKWTLPFVPPDVRHSWNTLEVALQVEETTFDNTFDNMQIGDFSRVAPQMGMENFLDENRFMIIDVIM